MNTIWTVPHYFLGRNSALVPYRAGSQDALPLVGIYILNNNLRIAYFVGDISNSQVTHLQTTIEFAK